LIAGELLLQLKDFFQVKIREFLELIKDAAIVNILII
jgi:hypothetical protein